MSQPDVPPVEETQQIYPPFSGASTRCPKCGHDDDPTTYITYLSYGICDHFSGTIIGVQMNERLHRTCGRCSYAWDEAVL